MFSCGAKRFSLKRNCDNIEIILSVISSWAMTVYVVGHSEHFQYNTL